jgi:hypothetical protein
MQLVSTLAHEKCLSLYLQGEMRIPCGCSQPSPNLEHLTDWLEQAHLDDLGNDACIPLWHVVQKVIFRANWTLNGR